MTGPNHTPTDRGLAELALAADSAHQTPGGPVSLEEALHVLDDPRATPERRAQVLRELNRDPELYRAWLAGRRVARLEPAPLPAPAPRARADGWLRSLFDRPWQTAGATAVVLLAGVLVGRLVPRSEPGPVSDSSPAQIVVPAPHAKGPNHPSDESGLESGPIVPAPMQVPALNLPDLDYASKLWLHATRDLCASRHGSGANIDWQQHGRILVGLADRIHAASELASTPATAPMREITELNSQVAPAGEDDAIRIKLCSPASILAIGNSLQPPEGDRPIG